MDWAALLQRLRNDERTLLAAVPVCLFALLLAPLGLGVLTLALCVSAAAAGYYAAIWACSSCDGYFLAPLVESVIGGQVEGTGRDKKASPVVDEDFRGRRKPWDGLFLPRAVNESLETLAEELLEQYVNNWYGGGISRDRAFLNDIRYQVRFAASHLFRRIRRLDLAKFILEEVVPPAALHIRRVLDAEAVAEKTATPSTLEKEIASRLGDVHFALGSRENEADYLRQLVEFLLPRLFDESRLAGRASDDDSPSHRKNQAAQPLASRPWPNHCVRHFMRELLTHSVLLPLLDVIADPDTINHLLILLFDTSAVTPDSDQITASSGHDPEDSPFLGALTSSVSDDLPDSLLQLKLSDILVDPRLFSMFRIYLSDTGGAVNELKFLADARRIHDHMQRKDEQSSKTTYDAWQLYGQFVHDSASDRIFFSPGTVEAFRDTIEVNNLTALEKIVEKTYQEVYSRMQWEHVVPFCQSENFLGHLCGSPPRCLDNWIEPPQVSSTDAPKAPPPERAFTIAQLRNQIFSTLKSPSQDEETAGGAAESVEEEDMEEVIEDLVDVVEEEEEMLLEAERRARREAGEGGEENTTAHWQMPPLPSIDVSEAIVPEDVDSIARATENYPSPSECSSVHSGGSVSPAPSSYLVIDPDYRDINKWRVTIPTVQPVRDSVSGRVYYAYVIEVLRPDAEEHETKTWNILRRYTEFFVLEGKLNEFHENSLKFAALPQKKIFVAHTREFIEQYRLTFAAFLAGLCKQRLLARSDLLFAFLTSPDEFRDSINLSELNPIKMVRRMPGRLLTRERGQHLRPFVLHLMAATLAESNGGGAMSAGGATVAVAEEAKEDKEDISSLSSDVPPAPFSLYSSVYGQNLAGWGVRVPPVSSDEEEIGEENKTEEPEGLEKAENKKGSWTRSLLDSLLLLFAHRLPSWRDEDITSVGQVADISDATDSYAHSSASSAHSSFSLSSLRAFMNRTLLSAVRLLSRSTFDNAARVMLDDVLKRALREPSMVACIQALQRALFCQDNVACTEQEKLLRMELAGRRTQQFVEESLPPQIFRLVDPRDLRLAVADVVRALQYPCLNKQLSYVLLDRIVEKMFIE